MRIHIVMSSQTLAYADYCVYNHVLLANDPTSLDFVFYCLDGSSFTTVSQRSGPTPVHAKRVADGSGSIGHMIGLRAALENFDRESTNVIVDSDCVVLMRGWDAKLREIMTFHDAVGTVYEDIGGFSSGNGTVQTYKRVPNFNWCALSPRFDWNFDVSADKANPLKIDDERLSRAFNLPIGFSLFREPCWKFPLYVDDHSIFCYPLEFVRPTSGKALAVTTGQDYHTEYQLCDGTPFCAHQRGSMSKQFRTHPLSKTFYDACEAYITRTDT